MSDRQITIKVELKYLLEINSVFLGDKPQDIKCPKSVVNSPAQTTRTRPTGTQSLTKLELTK